MEDQGIPPPPELPKNTAAPWINITTSSYQEEWGKMADCERHSDVAFLLGDKSFSAHRYVEGRRGEERGEDI